MKELCDWYNEPVLKRLRKPQIKPHIKKLSLNETARLLVLLRDTDAREAL